MVLRPKKKVYLWSHLWKVDTCLLTVKYEYICGFTATTMFNLNLISIAVFFYLYPELFLPGGHQSDDSSPFLSLMFIFGLYLNTLFVVVFF